MCEYEIIDESGNKITGEKAKNLCCPDWSKKCEVCGASPILPLTGMCGPCTFGEAETIDGNWF